MIKYLSTEEHPEFASMEFAVAFWITNFFNKVSYPYIN
jgi:hypothetical protein